MPVLSCPMKVRVRATSSKGSQLQHLPMQLQGDHRRLSYTILVTGQCLQKICEIEVQSSIRHVRVAEKPAVHRLLDHGPDTQNGAEPDHEGLPLLRITCQKKKVSESRHQNTNASCHGNHVYMFSRASAIWFPAETDGTVTSPKMFLCRLLRCHSHAAVHQVKKCKQVHISIQCKRGTSHECRRPQITDKLFWKSYL